MTNSSSSFTGDGIWTNTRMVSTRRDTVMRLVGEGVGRCQRMDIASAFFSLDQANLARVFPPSCQARLVVRLGYPTNPYSLRRLLPLQHVSVRYFVGREFHPKFYIFHNLGVLVGSANCTDAGMQANNETCVFIDEHLSQYEALLKLFEDYWGQANALTEDVLDSYQEEVYAPMSRADQRSRQVTGDLFPDAKYRYRPMDSPVGSKEELAAEHFRRRFQEFVKAIERLEEAYQKIIDRSGRFYDDTIPIRIEVMAFTGWSGDRITKNDIPSQLLGFGSAQQHTLEEWVLSFIKTDSQYYRHEFPEAWHEVSSTLANQNWVKKASEEKLWHALRLTHSFSTHTNRLATYESGQRMSIFYAASEPEAVRRMLQHLFWGPGGTPSLPDRMAECVVGGYRQSSMGESTIMDLVGWVHWNAFPPVNGRTVRVLQYFGFAVPNLQ